ncbi:MAG TPA: NUDIX domain-containing protein [Bosea sp. (in: a-proteobacteria)]|jgi:8-oxo-dGTP pyrophosphatase MutT (NUDIX family)|nr:NUDIX domain-containing protein [Bosea sp. (in: a-proteobacteria)]
MTILTAFLDRLDSAVSRYLAEVAGPRERLALLRWQIAERHLLDARETMPGHATTSAFVLSPDHGRILLIDHVVIGRWLQPGGHYEPAATFHDSAQREAVEETGVSSPMLHPWHRGGDLPFAIDSQEVPGNPRRNEPPHIHHDLQYLFTADPALPLIAEEEEVHAAAWKPIAELAEIAPVAFARLRRLSAPG